MSEPCHLDFSFVSKLLQPVMQFACFPGHYASIETPDLHHKRYHLHRSHLDHGYLLFTPTCYLPEIIYLQVQVRLTSKEQPRDSEDFDIGELPVPVPATQREPEPFSLPLYHPVASRPVPILCIF